MKHREFFPTLPRKRRAAGMAVRALNLAAFIVLVLPVELISQECIGKEESCVQDSLGEEGLVERSDGQVQEKQMGVEIFFDSHSVWAQSRYPFALFYSSFSRICSFPA